MNVVTPELVDDFLDHHGIKGQKWGIRRAQRLRNLADRRPTRGNVRKADRAARKVDRKWQKNIYSVRGAITVHNASADLFNQRIDAINKDPKFKNSHLDHPDRPATQAYLKAVTHMSETSTKQAVDKVHGVSPSGQLKARYDSKNQRIVVESTNVGHSDDILPTLMFEVNVDDNGKVSSLRSVQDTLVQDGMNVDEDDADEDDADGVMIALLPIVSDWCKLDLPHLTLVYAGKMSDLKPTDFNEMAKDASMLACLSKPITLMVAGREAFGDPGDDPVDVFRLRPSQQVLAMRRFVDDWNASEYDFSPHVTIGPVGTLVDMVPRYIAFDRIAVVWGPDSITFNLNDGGNNNY